MALQIFKAFNRSSVWSVHRGNEYLGYVYAVEPRAWANVFDSDDNWLASVKGGDKIQGNYILDSHGT